MSDDLRTRIAAVYRAHRLTFFAVRGASVPKCDCGWQSPEEYTTCTDHPEHVADAVIRELRLEALELMACSWYRNYDIIPANDPRCPTDMDIAYDDAGMQILTALGLLK